MVYSYSSFFRSSVGFFIIVAMVSCNITPVYSLNYVHTKGFFKDCDFSWVLDGIKAFGVDTTQEEAIEFAAKVKIKVQKFTGQKIHLKTTFQEIRTILKQTGVKISKRKLDELSNRIKEAERRMLGKKALPDRKTMFLSKGKRKSSSNNLNEEWKDVEIFGLVAIFSGILLHLIPIPGVPFVGKMAITWGVREITEGRLEEWGYREKQLGY